MKPLLIFASFAFMVVAYAFLFNPELFCPQQIQRPGHYKFTNNGILTVSLFSDGTINRHVTEKETIEFLSGADTVTIQLEQDVLMFVPTRRHFGDNLEYKIYSDRSRINGIAVLNIPDAKSFAYWVLMIPPTQEEGNYIEQYYFGIINEKILE